MNISWLETLTSEATCDVHSLPLEIEYAFTKQEFYFSDLRVIFENCLGPRYLQWLPVFSVMKSVILSPINQVHVYLYMRCLKWLRHDWCRYDALSANEEIHLMILICIE